MFFNNMFPHNFFHDTCMVRTNDTEGATMSDEISLCEAIPNTDDI